MAELPADVQAALDAYLAARGDDATWAAYVNSLGPGVALDIATMLCAQTCSDAEAAEWVGWHVLGDPEGEEPEEREPWGLDALSRSVDLALGGLADLGLRAEVTLGCEYAPDRRYWVTVWTARLEGTDTFWEAEGRVTRAEAERWRPITSPALWAVALCRALCDSWSPGWARAQHGD